ncbi:hypothetical protein SAMD00023353_11500130 [Rosellinia necatrix]|uniref:Uncharacterized protein n=1 Tax=Rosellinia necatrix TaxID=77044 RepID=A0A1S8AB64_ROSNE|nr:hypothetical protein SAMD00023353_11500130 [Rosellinia necatrix]
MTTDPILTLPADVIQTTTVGGEPPVVSRGGGTHCVRIHGSPGRMRTPSRNQWGHASCVEPVGRKSVEMAMGKEEHRTAVAILGPDQTRPLSAHGLRA